MPSPFPGMDPYLEQHWGDVHSRLITYIVDSLNESLPPDLAAASEERIAVEVDEAAQRDCKPDVRVIERESDFRSTLLPTAVGVATFAPYRFLEQVADDPETEHFVRIVETGGDRQVTVIELVSPPTSGAMGRSLFARGARCFSMPVSTLWT